MSSVICAQTYNKQESLGEIMNTDAQESSHEQQPTTDLEWELGNAVSDK